MTPQSSLPEYEVIGTGDVSLRWLEESPVFSTELEQAAVDAWASRPESVFNGSLLICTDIRKSENRIDILSAFSEFRYYYAQKTTGIDFGLHIMAVSGLTLCEGHVIFARRAAQVTTYPGWLELVPSGSIDRDVAQDDGTVDFMKRLREEFTEETTLPLSAIGSVRPFGLVYDPRVKIYDVACAVELQVSTDEILAGLRRSDEYDEPVAVPLHELTAFQNQHGGEIIGASHAILAAWR